MSGLIIGLSIGGAMVGGLAGGATRIAGNVAGALFVTFLKLKQPEPETSGVAQYVAVGALAGAVVCGGLGYTGEWIYNGALKNTFSSASAPVKADPVAAECMKSAPAGATVIVTTKPDGTRICEYRPQ